MGCVVFDYIINCQVVKTIPYNGMKRRFKSCFMSESLVKGVVLPFSFLYTLKVIRGLCKKSLHRIRNEWSQVRVLSFRIVQKVAQLAEH